MVYSEAIPEERLNLGTPRLRDLCQEQPIARALRGLQERDDRGRRKERKKTTDQRTGEWTTRDEEENEKEETDEGERSGEDEERRPERNRTENRRQMETKKRKVTRQHREEDSTERMLGQRESPKLQA